MLDINLLNEMLSDIDFMDFTVEDLIEIIEFALNE